MNTSVDPDTRSAHAVDSASSRRGLVVSRRITGLGDCLVSLLPAWRYAESTGRGLVVDWRGSPYCLSLGDNAFDLFFDAALSFGPVWEPLESLQKVHANEYFPALTRDNRWERGHDDPGRAQVLDVLKHEKFITDKVLLCDFCTHDALPRREICRELLGRLHLRRHWRNVVREQASQPFDDGPVVGLHVRRGDEPGRSDHERFWDEPVAALAHIKQAVSAMQRRFAGLARVFVSTDIAAIERILLDAIPRTFTRPRWRPSDARLVLHRRGCGWRAVADTIVDMQLLTRCDALVRYPPNSFFSFWADTLHDRHGTVVDGEILTDVSAHELGRPGVAWST